MFSDLRDVFSWDLTELGEDVYIKISTGTQGPPLRWVHTDPLAFGGPRPVYTLRYLEILSENILGIQD